jgi:SAM-dependent methyltransferase
MGTYVQYGCGLSSPPGRINFDVSPTLRMQRLPLIGSLFKHGPTIFPEGVCVGDIVAGLPLPDGSADGVYASHVLEHLSYDDFWVALRNTHRLLKPGGLFRLVVPDLEMRARKYLNQLDDGIVDSNSMVHGSLKHGHPSARTWRGWPRPFNSWQ